MAPSGSYFHLVFILLPLLISGQVDPVDKSQSSPSGQVDPVDKACEEGIDCVHKTECENQDSSNIIIHHYHYLALLSNRF